jgi:hypothetical protein
MNWLDNNLPGNLNDCTLTLSESTIESIKLYPNPAKDEFYLHSDSIVENEVIKLTIFDLAGRKVMNISIDSKQKSVDISQLSSGTYVVTIATDNFKEQHKLIVE